MKKQIIYITLFFCLQVVVSCTGNAQTKTAEKTGKLTELTANKKVSRTYKLKGFNKACCIGIVNYSLKEVDGFLRSEADVKKQEITVWYTEGKCSEKTIKESINKTGYTIID